MRKRSAIVVSLLLWLATAFEGRVIRADDEIDFNRDVRPLLNKHCTACHGGVKQAGGVSFVVREKAFAEGDSGVPTIVPGDLEESELYRRITLSADDDERMPPLDHQAEGLSQSDIETLRKWIASGANWGEHWAFVKPMPQPLPQVSNDDWPQRRLDYFVLAKLAASGYGPNIPAGPREWLRRVSFALTGLPPSEQHLALVKSRFDQPTREQIVDELLAAPAFGERWTAMWMDVARYADSMGYERDVIRTMWPYRDWLIRTFNDDLPINDFIIKQLAGDLIPNATLDDLIATGFLRTSQTNTEGGTDDEEFRIAAMLDRVATTWTAFQGVTFGCAQCHSHPYDPFPHQQYYAFAAYFNNLADCDLGSDFPTIKYPHDQQRREEVYQLDKEIFQLGERIAAPLRSLRESVVWRPLIVESRETDKPQVRLIESVEGGRAIQVTEGTPAQRSTYTLRGHAAGTTINAIQIESLMEPGTSRHTPSRAFVVTEFRLRIIANRKNEAGEDVEVKAAVDVNHVLGDDINGLIESPSWGAFPNQFQDRWVVLIPDSPLALGPSERLEIELIQKYGRDGAEPPVLRRFAISVSDDGSLRERSESDEHRAWMNRRREAMRTIKELPGVDAPIARLRPFSPREMAIFDRGSFLRKTDRIGPDVPTVFGRASQPSTRLEMARWLASTDNPLTSRIWVNRVWAELFGTGLVETQEDFGSTGTPPSNTALLDDLADRFQHEMRWSHKRLLRELVLSATFCQSANAGTSASVRRLIEEDPSNRLLGRGPRARLTSEMVRDQALTVGGLLSPTLYGPSVMPPQPDGVWNTPYSSDKWNTAEDADRYRRALYTFWRRSSPYPSFDIFDTPERKTCSARRTPTNTPLQALVTLNDPVYVEAANGLAARMIEYGGKDIEQRIRAGYEWTTSKVAGEGEVQTLLQLYRSIVANDQGSTEARTNEPSSDTQATRIVAATLLNLDAALTW